MRRALPGLLLVAAVGAFAAPPAEAIPAFARKYQFSCTVCHAHVPRLKKFGEDFAKRGFRLEDPSQEPPRATYDTGDPTLRLMHELPLALRFEGHGSTATGDEALNADVQWPWAFKVLSGGPISNHVSYYVYYILEKGGHGVVEDMWIQFSRIFNAPVDFTFGQFQVCDPMFKRELRLSRFDYQIFKTRVGLAPVDLTYDRGIIGSFAVPGGVETVVQLVNGNGIGEADGYNNYDNDSLKNLAVRVAWAGGKTRIGGFGYYGRAAGSSETRNRTYYIGPDLVIDFSDRWQLNLEYLERRDSNPMFLTDPAGSDWETRGGFAELVYLPLGVDGKLSIAGLYNKVASDDENARYHSTSAAVGWLLARNIRVTFEAGREFERKETRFSIGVVTAF